MNDPKPRLTVRTIGHQGHGKTALTLALQKVAATRGLAREPNLPPAVRTVWDPVAQRFVQVDVSIDERVEQVGRWL